MDTRNFIKKNISLKEHCSLQIGGNSKFFVEPSSENEIREAIAFSNNNNLPWYVIGNGSNLLFNDDGYNGVIIKIGDKFSDIYVKGNSVTVQAGAWMPYVAKKSQQNSLTGLEHTIGIPGNIGGIITMNGGSQRKYIAQNIKQIIAIDENMETVTLKASECDFGYRKSIFQDNRYIIISVTLELESGKKNKIRQEMLKILKERRNKFPRKEPNCGSVFKSKPVYYDKYGTPGKIIEELKLKGYCTSDVCISKKHANFFVNKDNATAKDFKKLLGIVSDKVLKKHGFIIEPEVITVDNDKRKPIVSMISVFYNRGYCVDESVKSMLNQTFKDMEIILVDDGSTDNTLKKLKEYESNRVRIISHDNMGFVKSIKKAIEVISNGEYIAIHGSGDISLSDRIEKQVSFLLENKDTAVVGCWRKSIDEDGRTVKEYKINKSYFNQTYFLDKNPFSHGEIMYTKEIYTRVGGYDTYFKYAQDAELLLRLSKVTKMSIIEEVLYVKKALLDGVSYVCSKSIEQHKYGMLARKIHENNFSFDYNKGINEVVSTHTFTSKKYILRKVFINLYLKNFSEFFQCIKRLFS